MINRNFNLESVSKYAAAIINYPLQIEELEAMANIYGQIGESVNFIGRTILKHNPDEIREQVIDLQFQSVKDVKEMAEPILKGLHASEFYKRVNEDDMISKLFDQADHEEHLSKLFEKLSLHSSLMQEVKNLFKTKSLTQLATNLLLKEKTLMQLIHDFMERVDSYVGL